MCYVDECRLTFGALFQTQICHDSVRMMVATCVVSMQFHSCNACSDSKLSWVSKNSWNQNVWQSCSFGSNVPFTSIRWNRNEGIFPVWLFQPIFLWYSELFMGVRRGWCWRKEGEKWNFLVVTFLWFGFSSCINILLFGKDSHVFMEELKPNQGPRKGEEWFMTWGIVQVWCRSRRAESVLKPVKNGSWH